MSEIVEEVTKIREDGFELTFQIPTPEGMAKLRQLHRDRTEEELRRSEVRKKSVLALGKAAASGELTEEEFEALSPAERDALRRMLGSADDDHG